MKSRTTLWLVGLVTFGPFVVASLLYYGPWGRDWLPQLAGSRVLLETAVPLPAQWQAANLERRWTLLYARTTPCTAAGMSSANTSGSSANGPSGLRASSSSAARTASARAFISSAFCASV